MRNNKTVREGEGQDRGGEEEGFRGSPGGSGRRPPLSQVDDQGRGEGGVEVDS